MDRTTSARISPLPAAAARTPAPAPAPAPSQPTYTTAGTLYNPNASQPLQPPTRRGRAFRWSHGGMHTDLALLPKSVLATLPLRSVNHRTPTGLLQQYSPLQQNYDRAVSPNLFHDPDHLFARMPPQNPPDEPVYGSAALSGDYMSDRPEIEDGCDENDGNDSDFGTDPLMGMPFKSLQNLASYPNPNQKRARKALLGAKPCLQGATLSSSNHTSPKSASFGPIGSPRKCGSNSSDTAFRGGSSHSNTRRHLGTTRGEPERRHLGTTRGEPERRHEGTPGLLATARVFEPVSSHSTLSDGPGAPRALTAGPPGQRQYRPSTFESTFEALQTAPRQSRAADFGHDGAAIVGDSLFREVAGEEQLPTSTMSLFHADGPANSPAHLGSGIHPRIRSGEENLALGDSRPSGYGLPTSGMGLENAPNTTAPAERRIPSLRDPRPESRRRFEYRTDRLKASEIEARNDRIDRAWYSGSGILDKSTADTMVDVRFRRLQHSLGAIGDGRPNKNKREYRPISPEEAAKMTTAEHAKPLLDMGFASIVRWNEEQAAKKGRGRAQH